MNDMSPAETGTALALPGSTDLAALFKAENGIAGIVAKLETAARADAKTLDPSTKKGREALISLAAKVSKSKAELDRQGKALTEEQRKEINAVNAGRKVADERLAALRDEIRQPVTDWEAKEEERVAMHKRNLAFFDLDQFSSQDDPSQIKFHVETIEMYPMGDGWEEFAEIATARRAQALTKYRADLAAAEKRVADEAELAQLRAEAAERARRDAAEAEAKRLAAEKAEADRLAAEAAQRAEQERIEAEKREADRQAQIERDRVEAAQRAAEEAEARAAREAQEREERHTREIAEAKQREEAAAQRERDRIAAEKKAADDARAKREADQAHRDRIRADIVHALETMRGAATPDNIAEALMAGKIPHCEVAI